MCAFYMWHNPNLFLNVAFVTNDPHATSTAGWRLITFPCSMPSCVTPWGTPHSPKGSLVLLPNMFGCVFFNINIFFFSDRGSFLVLSAPGHAGSPPEHLGVSVGSGRGPSHVLWGFKVASKHWEAFRARRAIHAHENPRTG